MNLFDLFSGMQYPHWMMIGGGALVVLGFVGFAFRQNHAIDRGGASDDERLGEG
jgi:hypothetical protein